jgi:hypothetical protein
MAKQSKKEIARVAAVEAGRKAGRETFEHLLSELGASDAILRESEDVVKKEAVLLMPAVEIDNGFDGAFVEGFLAAWRARRADLPEVKAARRAEYLRRKLDSMNGDAISRLATFRDRFEQDASNAFRWADSAMDAAATLEVVAKIREIVDHENGGVERAVEYAREQALMLARHSSQSTSISANAMARYQLAAFAEITDPVLF